MSIQQTYIFDNALDYTLTNTQIASGKAKLALIPNTGISKSNGFSVDTGITYNATLAEVASGLLRQKSQIPTGALFGAKFTSNFDLNWAVSGSLSSVQAGTPTISSGRLACLAYANNGIKYSNAQIATITTQGCVKFKFTPNYTGIQASDARLFTLRNGSNDNDLMTLMHTGGTQKFYLICVNSTSSSVVFNNAMTGSLWNPTAGQEYEFEFNFNTVSGLFSLYINGTQVATNTITYTRAGGAPDLHLGYAVGLSGGCNGYFDDLVVFNTVQHTANYTSGYVLPNNIYVEASASSSFTSSTPFNFLALESIATVGEVGSVRFTIGGKYWNGSAWAVSDGTYAQANSSATILANVGSFSIASTTIAWSIVFPDSNTLHSIDSFSLTLTEQVYASTGYVVPTQPIESKGLLDYVETITTDADTSVKAIVSVDGVLKWWNGTAWVVSNGTAAESNTASELNTNLPSLTLDQNSTILFKWVLSTTDNTKTPLLDTSTITYNFGAIEEGLDTCLVYGFIKDISGIPVENATVTFDLTIADEQYVEASSHMIFTRAVKVKTDATGYFEVPLVKTSVFTVATVYSMTVSSKGLTVEKNGTAALTFTVPDATTKDITDILPV